MSDNPFFDSNVLLYLASDDGAKANRAEALLADRGTISVQVLNEMSNVAIRKHGMTWTQVGILLEPVRALCRIEPLTEATYDLGAELAARYRLSVYDAMIVAAALLAGANGFPERPSTTSSAMWNGTRPSARPRPLAETS